MTASKSGKLTSDHLKRYLTEVFFPNVGEKSVLLLDSWSGQCERTVFSVVPEDKEFVHLVIPKGSNTAVGRIRLSMLEKLREKIFRSSAAE